MTMTEFIKLDNNAKIKLHKGSGWVKRMEHLDEKIFNRKEFGVSASGRLSFYDKKEKRTWMLAFSQVEEIDYNKACFKMIEKI